MIAYGSEVFHHNEYTLIDKTLEDKKRFHFNSLFFSPYDTAEEISFILEDVFNPL